MTLLPGFNQEIVGFERDQKARQGLQRQKSGREDKKWSLAGCRGKRRLEGCLGGESCEELCGRAGEAAAHEGQALSWGRIPARGLAARPPACVRTGSLQRLEVSLLGGYQEVVAER